MYHEPSILKTHQEKEHLITGLETKFNTVWYQLYKMLDDIQLRKVAQFNPTAKAKSELLTKFTKQTLQKCINHPDDFSPPTNPAGKAKTEQKLAFLNEEHSLNPVGLTQGKYNNKYKRWVLEAYGNEERKRNESTISKSIFSRNTSVECTKTSVIAQNKLAPLRLRNIKHCEGSITPFEYEPDIKVVARTLFGEDIFAKTLTNEHSLSNSPLKIVKKKRLKKQRSVPLMPYYTHAQQTASPTPLQKLQALKDYELLQECRDKYMATIYGAKRASSPIPKEKLIKCHTNKSIHIRSERHNFNQIIAERTKAKLYHTENTISSKSHLTQCNSSKASTMDKLLEDFDFAHRETKSDFKNLGLARKTIMEKIHKMRKTLSEEQRENKVTVRHQKQFKDKKRLFIYGKKGQGRFLSVQAKDMVRISDLIMRMNPKYPFLHGKFKDILTKTDL